LERLHRRDGNMSPAAAHWTIVQLDEKAMLEEMRIEAMNAPRYRGGGCEPAREAVLPPTPAPRPEPKYVPPPSSSESSQPKYAAPPKPITSLQRDVLAVLHRETANDFVHAERLGFARDRDYVAGFEPHRFTNMPELKKHLVFGTYRAWGDWKVERVELVSLRKAAGPHAYLSSEVPDLKALRNADTRLLDDFEIRALAQLHAAKNVVIEQTDGLVRMVGALRAGNNCLRCHAGARGELIGAISYEIHHTNYLPHTAEQ
jgi:hypothetical protein